MAIQMNITTEGLAKFRAALETGNLETLKTAKFYGGWSGGAVSGSVVATLDIVVNKAIESNSNICRFICQDKSDAQYTTYGGEVIDADGVVVATFNNGGEPVSTKQSKAEMMLGFEIKFEDNTAASSVINMGDTTFIFDDATETAAGIIELATEAEAKAGTDTKRAITPKVLDAVIEAHENVVHRTGQETIAGKKSFTESVEVKRVNPYFDIVQTDITKGTPPTGTSYAGVRFGGSDGVSADGKQFCAILHTYDKNGNNALRLQVKKHEADSTENAELAIFYGADGIPYAVAPTPSTTDKSNKVATTEWVRSIALALAGGKMIGAITFEKNEDQKIQVLDGGDLLIGSTSDSSLLRLRGENSDEYQGAFQLRAGAKDKDPVYLIGNPDGTLTWDGKTVERVVSSSFGSNSFYIKYASGLIIQGGTNNSTTSGQVTFPVSFSSASSYTLALTRSTEATGSNYAIYHEQKTATGFVGLSATFKHPFSWIAIGK